MELKREKCAAEKLQKLGKLGKLNLEVYSQPIQTSRMELLWKYFTALSPFRYFTEIWIRQKSLIVFAEKFRLDIW